MFFESRLKTIKNKTIKINPIIIHEYQWDKNPQNPDGAIEEAEETEATDWLAVCGLKFIVIESDWVPAGVVIFTLACWADGADNCWVFPSKVIDSVVLAFNGPTLTPNVMSPCDGMSFIFKFPIE